MELPKPSLLKAFNWPCYRAIQTIIANWLTA